MGTDLENMVEKSGGKVEVMNYKSPFSSIFSLPMQTISQTGAFVNVHILWVQKKLQKETV